MNPIISKLGIEQGWLNYPYLDKLPPKSNYGLHIPEDMEQYHIELYLYAFGDALGAGRGKFFHMMNAIRLGWEKEVEVIANGYPNTTFLRVIWNLCNRADLGIAGSASSGKTYPVGLFMLNDWRSAPNITLTFVGTTSLSASDDRIWGQIVARHKDCKYQIGDLVAHRHAIAWGGESGEDREFKNAIKAIAIEQGLEGQKAIETTRGRKNPRVRLVFDELPEMGTYCSAARVNLTSNPDFRYVGIGNPYDWNDAHGQLCQPKDGIDSVNETTLEWKTRTGYCIFLNGQWSPNFDAPPDEEPFPYLTNRQSLARMAELCHGNTESIEYYRNAIGFWVKSANMLNVLNRQLVTQYECDMPCRWATQRKKPLAALDVGFVAGGDKCVANFGHLGEEFRGRTMLEWKATSTYHCSEGEIFEQSIAKQFVDECVKRSVEPDCAGMDISSDGGKIYAEIVRYWLTLNPNAPSFHPISSMGKASESIVSDKDKRTCREAYDRKVTELWMSVRVCVMSSVIRGFPVESDVMEQFSKRRYAMKKGNKTAIETKGEMKLRLGRSPDDADSFVYLVEMAKRHGLEPLAQETLDSILKDKYRRDGDRVAALLSGNPVNEPADYGSDDWGERD